MKYTWKLKGLKRKDTSDLNNVVVQTYWDRIGTDDNGNFGTFNGATPFNLATVDVNKFVKYEDLTEEMVLGWIKSLVNESYETHMVEVIKKQIDDKISPSVEVTSGFPWSTESDYVTPPIPPTTKLSDVPKEEASPTTKVSDVPKEEASPPT